MAKLVLSENVCLDGVVADPVGTEGTERGGWFTAMAPEDYAAWAEVEHGEADAAEAILMGRRTDEFFGRAWNTREGAWADRLRSLPKYVVSSTAQEAQWVGGTVVSGPVVEEVTRVKEKHDGDVLVFGSAQLVRTLWEHGLVDELRLTVHPWLIGTGDRLFDAVPDRTRLALTSNRTLGASLVHLVYEVLPG